VSGVVRVVVVCVCVCKREINCEEQQAQSSVDVNVRVKWRRRKEKKREEEKNVRNGNLKRGEREVYVGRMNVGRLDVRVGCRWMMLFSSISGYRRIYCKKVTRASSAMSKK